MSLTSIINCNKLQEQVKSEYFNNVRRSNIVQTSVINRNAEIENLTQQNNTKAKYIAELLDELTQVKLNTSDRIKHLTTSMETLEMSVTKANYVISKTSKELTDKTDAYNSLKVLCDEYKRRLDELNQKMVSSMTSAEVKESKNNSHAIYDIFDALHIEYKRDADDLQKYVEECIAQINIIQTTGYPSTNALSADELSKIKLQWREEFNNTCISDFLATYSGAEQTNKIASLSQQLDSAQTALLDAQKKYDAQCDELDTNKNLLELERENSKNQGQENNTLRDTISSLTNKLIELEERGRALINTNKTRIKSVEDSKAVISSLYKSKFNKSLTPKREPKRQAIPSAEAHIARQANPIKKI